MPLTAAEKQRVQDYADRWFSTQDVYTLSVEERRDFKCLLTRWLQELELTKTNNLLRNQN